MGGIRNYNYPNIIFVHDFAFIFLILVFFMIMGYFIIIQTPNKSSKYIINLFITFLAYCYFIGEVGYMEIKKLENPIIMESAAIEITCNHKEFGDLTFEAELLCVYPEKYSKLLDGKNLMNYYSDIEYGHYAKVGPLGVKVFKPNKGILLQGLCNDELGVVEYRKGQIAFYGKIIPVDIFLLIRLDLYKILLTNNMIGDAKLFLENKNFKAKMKILNIFNPVMELPENSTIIMRHTGWVSLKDGTDTLDSINKSRVESRDSVILFFWYTGYNIKEELDKIKCIVFSLTHYNKEIFEKTFQETNNLIFKQNDKVYNVDVDLNKIKFSGKLKDLKKSP